MRLFQWLRLGCGLLASGLLLSVAQAATWFPLGPFGGDARAFAADPADSRHVFLGTLTGWIYESHDGGSTWVRVTQIANRNDLVVKHILMDPKNPKRLLVATYTVDHPGGGLYISEDYGKNWYSQAEMRGQSIRALARSISEPNTLVAGTLRGVFRSRDNGVHWTQISPQGSNEIHEVESIAIDPVDANVIYAGTWHLPWKTTDGGATWSNIKDGIIDDSDVFSIIVDPKDPQVVYASACSGIYKSSNAGDKFVKVQGIPSTARRTRTLEQDPRNLAVVFAGTTEGLYRTEDAGAKWDRLTPNDVIVNDVYVDPGNPNHVLIATDRGGVYRSEDAGASFEPSNKGFSARQVTAYAADPHSPDTVYVGVVNDKTTGGVFQSTNGGVQWHQQAEGLGGRDVFSLLALEDGTVLAGTGHGIFRLQGSTWVDSSAMEGVPVPAAGEKPSKSNVTLPAPTRLHTPGPETHGPGSGSSGSRGAPKKPAVKKSAVHASRWASSRPGHGGLLRTAFLQSRPQRALALQRKASESHRPAAVRSTRSTGVQPAALRGRTRAVATKRGAATMRPAVGVKSQVSSTSQAHKTTQESRLDAVVYALARSQETLFAATSSGLVRSTDTGQHWTDVSSLTMTDVHHVAVLASSEGHAPPMVLATSLQRLALSPDGGATWDTVALPAELTQIGAAAIDGDKNLWVGGREGVWLSTDFGANWRTLKNLFLTEVDNLFYDTGGKRLLVTASNSPVAFDVSMGDHKVSYWDTGWKLRFVRPVGDHLIGATLFDGVVVQPKMVDSSEATASVSSR